MTVNVRIREAKYDTRRIDRRAVGETAIPSSPPEGLDWPTCQRSSSDYQCPVMARSHGSPVARSARALWTVASRFYRWQKAGIWQCLLAALQEQSDASNHLDWENHYVDSTIVRAHQHAAGAKGGNPAREALGRSQGGFGTKLHLRAEGSGKPITFVLTPGQFHEAPIFEQLLEQGAVKRANGRIKQRPKRIIGL